MDRHAQAHTNTHMPLSPLQRWALKLISGGSVLVKVESVALCSCVCRANIKPCSAPLTALSANVSQYLSSFIPTLTCANSFQSF